MYDLYASLAWLPRPPHDFTALCRGVLSSFEDLGPRLQWLAWHALDEIQLNQLARQVARAHERGYSLAPLSPFKLGVISTANTDFVSPAIIATALRYGIAIQCIKAPFGQFAQQALSADSDINRGQPDAVLIAADVILAVAPNLLTVMIGVAVWGLHMGMTQGLLAALIADAAPQNLRATAFGVFNFVSGIALLLASLTAGLL